jgi:hypothetical protein
VIRKILTILLPLVLPTLVYMAYVYVERRRQAAAGTPVPWWVTAPWPWLVSIGVLLCGLTMGVLAVTGGADPHAGYVPAHLGSDGQLVPARQGK